MAVLLMPGGILAGSTAGAEAAGIALSPPPSVPPTISGYLCAAVVGAEGIDSGGCGGYAPVPGVTIYLSNWSALPPGAPIVWPAAPDRVPHVATAISSGNGSFGIPDTGLSGAYALWSGNTTGFGGGFASLHLSSGSVHQDLIAYPYEAQDNTTIVLPGFNNLSEYAANGNCLGCGGARGGNHGTQIPILSWTQDGAFYVNASLRFVFYSFANRTVRDLGPWWPLYDDVMYYDGIENTEWLTSDGSYVFEFGCLSSCNLGGGGSGASSLAFYAINVTTGRSFSWNFTGVDASATSQNAQIDMIGEGGNHSIALLTVGNGNAYAYNLWNDTQWLIGHFTYFEANNNYWLPQLDSYIDQEAQGASSDRVSQWELEGPSPGTRLVQVASLSYWTGRTAVNGGQWGGYDVTTHEIALLAQSLYSTIQGVFVFGTTWNGSDGTFVLSDVARSYTSPGPSYPVPMWIPFLSEHRMAVLAAGYEGGSGPASFYNVTMYGNPFDGAYLGTNVTTSRVAWNPTPPTGGFWTAYDATVGPENLFYNASYSITSYSVACRPGCSITGATGGALGTISWLSPSQGPEYPFPASAAIAQPDPPGAPTDLTLGASGFSVTAGWQPPTTGENPIVNYTLFWGYSPAYGHSVDLLPTNRSFLLDGLTGGRTVYLSLVAANLHGAGPAASASLALGSHRVTFTESGLPDGMRWYVNSTRGYWPSASAVVSSSGAGQSIAIGGLPNGTFGYTLAAGAGWASNPPGGNVTIAGSNRALPVSFVRVAFSVTFARHGLPEGTNWSITLRGITRISSSSEISFSERNGTYGYSVGSVPGYTAPNGFVEVQGPIGVPVSFARILYRLAFDQSGLASGTSWTVTVNGTSLTSPEPSLVFELPNGSYPFSVEASGFMADPAQGLATLAGAGASQPVVFTAVAFSVSFNETGLPNGTQWSVDVGGQGTRSSTNGTIVFQLSDGVYSFVIAGPAGYASTPAIGSVNVSGRNASVAVSFAPARYALTFSEEGLPEGTVWSVMAGPVSASSPTSGITLDLPNGTVGYTVSQPAGFVATPGSGTLRIDGRSLGLPIRYSPLASSAYPLTLSESGLPLGGNWSVRVGSVSESTNGSRLTLAVAAGTYPYSILSSIGGWGALPPRGTFAVSGPTSVSVTFVAVYPLVAIRSGLPTGMRWYLNVTGTATAGPSAASALPLAESASSLGPAITLPLPNGTYAYRFAAEGSTWVPLGSGGSVSVLGAAPGGIAVTFALLEAVTFGEIGLARGTAWSVTLNGTTHTSTTPSISFVAPNGSYAWRVGAVMGYTVGPSGGQANVSGPSSLAITFAPVVGPAAGSPGIPIAEALLFAGLVGVTIGTAVALSRHRRSRPPQGTPARTAEPAAEPSRGS